MEFYLKKGNIERQHSDCIIVGVFELRKLSLTAEKLDKISGGYISSLLCCGELEGNIGQTLLLYHVPNILSDRILLIGCGKECDLDEKKYKKIINKAIITLSNTGSIEAVCFLSELSIKGYNIYWKIRRAVEIVQETLYVFDQFKSSKIIRNRALCKIVFNVPNKSEFIIGTRAISHGLAIAAGIKLSKDLSNMPPNICNSVYLVAQAHQLASNYTKTITVEVIGEQKIKELGMNAYLAVGQGSNNESIMSIIKYNGNLNKNVKPIILIGKGLTFDSGGISVKPADRMNEMKYDMCGAATIYGIMHIVAELNLSLNIIGVIASCENTLDSKSFRPGDVLTTLSGQTVEVLNTDAEGRLVLCDVLTYIERFDPDIVIDIATLTGACVVALGHHFTGLMSNCKSLTNELIFASENTGDYIWELPMTEEFKDQLSSDIADISNVGGRSGGAITAGCFLGHFAKNYNWAHLDISGTAWNYVKIKGATGRPISMLSQFLFKKAQLSCNK